MPSRKVFIVADGRDPVFEYMFKQEGWEIASSFKEADLVQFTGGEDVNPALYGEPKHPHTLINQRRDQRERFMFQAALAAKKPMAGVCRGGQFLNVMCGGKLWQHVDGHALRDTHEARDMMTGEVFSVTSTHHQMMRPNLSKSYVLLVAQPNISSFKERVTADGNILKLYQRGGQEEDVEACVYWDENVLCFQPHPEYARAAWLRKKYVQYIQDYLF